MTERAATISAEVERILADALPQASAAALAAEVERISSPEVSRMYVPERRVLMEAALRLRLMGEIAESRGGIEEAFLKLGRYSRRSVLVEGRNPIHILREFLTRSEAYMQTLLADNHIEGASYWRHLDSGVVFALCPGDALTPPFEKEVTQISRAEFLSLISI